MWKSLKIATSQSVSDCAFPLENSAVNLLLYAFHKELDSLTAHHESCAFLSFAHMLRTGKYIFSTNWRGSLTIQNWNWICIPLGIAFWGSAHISGTSGCVQCNTDYTTIYMQRGYGSAYSCNNTRAWGHSWCNIPRHIQHHRLVGEDVLEGFLGGGGSFAKSINMRRSQHAATLWRLLWRQKAPGDSPLPQSPLTGPCSFLRWMSRQKLLSTARLVQTLEVLWF